MSEDPKPSSPPDSVPVPSPTPPGADADERGGSAVRVVDRRWWARQASGDGAHQDTETSRRPTYVEELERQLAEKDALLQTHITQYRTAASEFEQARLRARREVAKEVERGKRAIILELLDVLDNLNRALDAAKGTAAPPALVDGVDLVRTQFLSKLQALGVTRMDASGQRFDPRHHEAVSIVHTADPAAADVVVGVITPGYWIGDDVLRPAGVAVGRLESPPDA